MGVAYEVNWYLVAGDTKSILESRKENVPGKYIMLKKGKRLYPVGATVPLIVKEVGCTALVKITALTIDEEHAIVRFDYVEQLTTDSFISKHYYDMYLKMKNEKK